jgi:hypothetical protein
MPAPKKNLFAQIKAFWLFLRNYFSMPFALWSDIRETLHSGGVSIVTSFDYQAPNNPKIYHCHFRSSIQFGGNLINAIPDPHLYPEAEWEAMIVQQADIHFAKVWRVFERYQQMHSISARITQLFASIVGVAMTVWTDVSARFEGTLLEPLEQLSPVMLNLLLLATFTLLSGALFAYILKPLLFKWVVRKVKSMVMP